MSVQFEAARSAFVAGVTAFEAGELTRAETLFLDALRLVPGRPSALINLAAVRHRLGRPADALLALDQALEAEPGDAAAWYHRGQLLQALERPLDALGAYERVLTLMPQHGHAWSQRGSLLKDMGRLPEAAHCFRQALAHGGDAEMNRYFLASLPAQMNDRKDLQGGIAPPLEVPATAPRQYVEALFDSYAEGFDEHLVGKLGYRTPWLIAELLRSLWPAAPAAQAAAPTPGATSPPSGTSSQYRHVRAALDLGCGTGLMGPLLAPHCDAIDGIDLSRLMLEKAQVLGCYRNLLHGEVADYLAGTDARFQLVVAADVFVYIGDLDAVFVGVARVLDTDGVFAFSVEEAGAGVGRYELRASSRYAHSEGYVRTLAAARGFDVAALERTTLRHEQRRPIGGLLVALRAGRVRR